MLYLLNLYSSILNINFDIINNIEQSHIDLTPKFKVNTPPMDPPTKNDKIIIKYLIALVSASLFFFLIAK